MSKETNIVKWVNVVPFVAKKICGWALVVLGVYLFGASLARTSEWLVFDAAVVVGYLVGVSMLPACFVFLGWYLLRNRPPPEG